MGQYEQKAEMQKLSSLGETSEQYYGWKTREEASDVRTLYKDTNEADLLHGED